MHPLVPPRCRPLLLLLVLAATGGSACAADPAPCVAGGNPLGGLAPAVADAALAAGRGGYQAAGGLLLSFGIARSVTLDGATVATTTLVGSGGGSTDGAALTGGTFTVIRSGPGNAVGPLAASGAAIVVQNTLDGRRIEATTVIDATANSLSLVRQSALQSSLRSAVIDSLRR